MANAGGLIAELEGLSKRLNDLAGDIALDTKRTMARKLAEATPVREGYLRNSLSASTSPEPPSIPSKEKENITLRHSVSYGSKASEQEIADILGPYQNRNLENIFFNFGMEYAPFVAAMSKYLNFHLTAARAAELEVRKRY